MNPSTFSTFLVLNIIVFALTVGMLVAIFYLTSRRKDVFSRLAQSLEVLGFTQRGWTRQVSAIPLSRIGGYYSATIDGKSFEAHFYAEGGRRFKLNPYVEFALLGYFNASLVVFTPNWVLSRINRMLPKKLALTGYEGLEIRTADEDSAKLLLEEANTCQLVRQLLADINTPALFTVSPRDMHLTVKLSDPKNISVSQIQTWTRSMAEIATIAAALPPLAPEVVYENLAQTQLRSPGARFAIFLLLLFLIIAPLIILAWSIGK